jgi:hypothetical protein
MEMNRRHVFMQMRCPAGIFRSDVIVPYERIINAGVYSVLTKIKTHFLAYFQKLHLCVCVYNLLKVWKSDISIIFLAHFFLVNVGPWITATENTLLYVCMTREESVPC